VLILWIKSERISAAEALQHPFFDPIRDVVETEKQKQQKNWKKSSFKDLKKWFWKTELFMVIPRIFLLSRVY